MDHEQTSTGNKDRKENQAGLPPPPSASKLADACQEWFPDGYERLPEKG